MVSAMDPTAPVEEVSSDRGKYEVEKSRIVMVLECQEGQWAGENPSMYRLR